MGGVTLAGATILVVTEIWPQPPSTPSPIAVSERADEAEPSTPKAASPSNANISASDNKIAASSGGDAAAGQRVFKKCAACHTVGEGGKHKVGPNLWSVVGRDVASAEGYKYSKALKEVGGVWTVEFFHRYLAAPRKAVKGTRMAFAGLRKQADRENLLAFLRTHSTGGQDTPAQMGSTSQPAKTAASALEAESSEKVASVSEKPGYQIKELKLPEGVGKEETEAYCGACHSMRLVVQQGQTREGWIELFEYMVEEHDMEPLPSDDEKLVLDYLSTNYGVKRKRPKTGS